MKLIWKFSKTSHLNAIRGCSVKYISLLFRYQQTSNRTHLNELDRLLRTLHVKTMYRHRPEVMIKAFLNALSSEKSGLSFIYGDARKTFIISGITKILCVDLSVGKYRGIETYFLEAHAQLKLQTLYTDNRVATKAEVDEILKIN